MFSDQSITTVVRGASSDRATRAVVDHDGEDFMCQLRFSFFFVASSYLPSSGGGGGGAILVRRTQPGPSKLRRIAAPSGTMVVIRG